MQQKLTLQFIIIFLVLFSVLYLPVLAEPRFASKQEMIKEAEDIAIVQITKVEQCSVKGSPWWDCKSWSDWTYHQRASAVVEKIFKGNLPKEITMYGGEDFTCTHINFVPGRCFVFLSHDHNLLIGCNWHLSVRPIKDGKLEWYNGENWYPLTLQDEPKVIDDVQAVLSKQK